MSLDEEAIKREIDPLGWARKRIEELDKLMVTAKDLGVAYQPEYLEASALLYELEPAEYGRHLVKLKGRGIRKVDFERKVRETATALKAAHKAREKTVAGATARADAAPTTSLAPPATEPWDRPVDGLTLLNDLRSYVSKFFVLADEALIAITLWIIFSYLLDIVEFSPRLAITSATKRCGKTFLLDLLAELMLKPLAIANMTSAVIFRVIEQEGCGLLIDEFDTTKAGSERAEEIRGILNSGWKRAGAYVPRVEKAGDNFVVKKFSTWAPIAVAAIGRLPDTLADRSIAIVMKRKSPKRKVERLIRRNKWAYQTAAETARKIQRWANDNRATLAVAKPALPDDIDDRAMNNWEILFAIADLAGGDWPTLARRAAVKLSSGRDDAGSLGEMLIVDIRKIFATRLKLDPAFDRIASVELCAALADMEAQPWAEFGRARKPISQPQLARQLSNFGIASATIRIGNDTPKGYYVKAFEDVFSSYSSEHPHPNRHNATTIGGVGESGDFQGATEVECGGTKNGTKPHGENECGTVADRTGEIRGAQETKEMTDSDEEGF